MGKLFLKLWVLILLTSLTSFKIQEAAFDYVYSENMTAISNERMRRIYVYIEEVLRPFPITEWPERFEQLKKNIGSPKEFMGPARLLNVSELSTEPRLNEEAIARIRSHQTFSHRMPEGSGNEMFHTILGTDYVVTVEIPKWKNQPIFGFLTSTQLTVFIEALLYGMAVLLWLLLFWWDMKKLDRAAGQVGEGHFNFHLDMRKSAALYPLADSFNKMKDRIAALLGSHKNLTNAVSHEFRTPITRLRFRHELAIQAKTLEEKDRELHLMDSAIDQLDDLSTELLEYARLDREQPTLDVGPIDVEPWLNELVEDAREVASATARGVQISVHADCEVIDGDHRYLSRAAANLLQNAVRYAKQHIEIRVGVADDKRYLHVDDDGETIPLADRERLFEPFTRLDNSRDRQSGGSGIGLAIVKQIARWHGGTAQITESKLGGTRVSLTW